MTPVFAATSMPSGTVMVKVQPQQQVIVGQVVQRPQFIQAQSISHIVSPPMIHAHPMVQPQQQAILNQVTQAAQQQQQENVKTVTVFVGSITDRASDSLIRQMLMKCGAVHTWKRVQGPDGKLQAFGFCEYKDPESALRAIEVLNGYLLGDKKIKIKVDSKTQKEIDEWKKSKGDNYKVAGIEDSKNMLASLMLEYTEELSKPKESSLEEVKIVKEPPKKEPEPEKVKAEKKNDNIDQNLEELNIDEDKKEDIGNEIRSFRESQRKEEEKKRDEKNKEKSRTRERTRERERSRRRRSPSPLRRSIGRTSRRSPARRRSPIRRSPARRSPARRRSRSPVRRRRERSKSPRSRRSRSTSLVLRYMDESDEEADGHEKRRLERKIKEKEKNYQERLRGFEMRERRKKREVENLEERKNRERKEMEREAKRLRDFLADYDDDKCDQKFYSGQNLYKRRNEREVEMAADAKDRKKEQEELELLKKKLIEEEHENVEGVLNKMKLVSENAWKPLLEPQSPQHNQVSNKKRRSEEKSNKRKKSTSVEDSESSSQSEEEERSSDGAESEEEEMQVEEEVDEEEVEAANNENIMTTETSTVVISSSDFDKPPVKSQPPQPPPQVAKEASPQRKIALKQQEVQAAFKPISLKTDSSKSTPQQQEGQGRSSEKMVIQKRSLQKLQVSEMFSLEDEDEDEKPKKRKFAPFSSSKHSSKGEEKKKKEGSVVDKKKLQRELIESIPSDKSKLFAYPLDWGVVDDWLMSHRIKPWVNKKIVQYIGEEEGTLVDFICDKIRMRYPPDKIQQDITMVLDEEAEVFVMKMWRLLIFEIEAKKRDIGI